MGKKGLTLLEVLIVVFLSSFGFLMLFVQLDVINKVKKNLEQVALAEEDFLDLSSLFRKISYRTRFANFEDFNPVGVPPTGGGRITGNGYMVLLADLRPCAQFVPGAPDAILTKLVFQCCDSSVPPASGVFTDSISGPAMPIAALTSVCGAKGGLSITSSNGQINRCYEHISSFTVSRVGFHAGFGSDLYYLALGSKRSFVGTENKKRSFGTYWGLGNTGSANLTYCQDLVGK